MPYFFTNLLPLLLMAFECGLGHGLPEPCDWMDAPILKEEACVKKLLAEDRCAIECNFLNDFTIDANSLPRELSELYIIHGASIQMDERSFSKLPNLELIIVRNVTSLTMKTSSFLNLSQQHLRLEISAVARAEIQHKAFYIIHAPITMVISQCDEVIIREEAITSIQELNITRVANLQLEKNALKPSEKFQEARTLKINLIQVTAEELPENSFPSSTKEITISACNIKTLRKNSISAKDGDNITIEDSVIDVIESEAFKRGSYFKGLILLKNVDVSHLQKKAILSAGTNFTVINSKIDTIHEQAFSMNTITNVLFANNNFAYIKTSGIDLSSWKTATFENNTLRKLSTNAIEMHTENSQAIPSKFVFVGNVFEKLQNYSLHFTLNQTIPFVVTENIFLHSCQCDLRAVFNIYIDSDYNLIDAMYNDSYCTISKYLSNCFHHPEGFMKTSVYTQRLCEAPPVINCPQDTESVTPENPNISKAVDILNENKLIREHQVISLLVVISCAGILAVLFLTSCLWFGRKEHTSRECHISSIGHNLISYLTHFMPSSRMVRARSTTSITRVAVHDYAEVRPQKYVDTDEDTYICSDKATQTLPEELTQELLQTLRDKLDDPENYREARCMIEHLYDLIKVEECCNNNQLSDDALGDLSPDEGVDILADTNENLYDTIRLEVRQQRLRRKSRSPKKYVHKGTRAPSPDKLSPQSYTNTSYTSSMRSRKSAPALTLPRPTITEYMQPVDHHSPGHNESLYDYASISSTLDVADRRSTNSTASTRKLTASYSIGPHILTDYKDPCDFKVPIYSELDDMIQRPLPLTPVDEQVNNDLGETRGTRL